MHQSLQLTCFALLCWSLHGTEGQPTDSEASVRLNKNAHPAQFAVDDDATSAWQSPTGNPLVEFAVDFGAPQASTTLLL
jgi:hypothetical protein